jgi:ribosome biogenesis GTPase A
MKSGNFDFFLPRSIPKGLLRGLLTFDICSSMPLSIGIIGLPNVGKSTLFQTITKKQVDIANYPFCTIDPNVGVVAVPDERVDALAVLTKSIKKIYTTIEFMTLQDW